MVSVVRRMRNLRTLLAIRLGPGAAVFPPEVNRIHMDFAAKPSDGHMGPRKFFKQCLPRLKFHNPAVPMTVNRTTDVTGPATLTIHFADPATAEKTGPAISSTTSSTTSTGPVAASTSPAPTIRTETIQMKHVHESEILSQVMALTKAKIVMPTPEEEQEIKDLQQQRVESEEISKKAKIAKEARKRAEAVISAARESA
ncbi:hypothetical protein BP6252_03367 [Coleophoma cylindrospora]|uniref:Ribosomal protein/NADH dehydrogenase domain-containing protein n=1 Tax=Coleophoma cylindrospora TaxID=1849047 RepID=A0A3D8S7H0_9HELO|nr:hypothetical protein BP6252_03367 [Coleophoma cylindrospora]